MFLLEDRVLFDAAIAIDIADAANTDEQSDDIDNSSDNSAEQNTDAFLQSPSEAQQAMPLPVNPYIDAVVRDALDGNLAALGLDNDFALPAVDNTVQTQVLLIADSLANADELYDAAGDNTIAIRYDATNTTTEQLLEQIEQSLDGEKIDRLGIAQQSDSDGKIDLLTNDSDTELWTGLNNLMTDDASIDLFASDMADSDFTDALAELTGHEVNYSDDLTGSDGNWTLEHGGIDLADTYFDGELAQNVNFTVLPAEPPHELAIINSSVMDAENIIDDLGDNVDVLILDGSSDPFEQINDYLDANDATEYDAMHIISHGNDGYFVLNGRIIDGDYATDNANDFAAIGEHLTTDGDIMIYGCDLAANTEGQSLVAQLADLTGADVAASNDTTSNIGGNWNLEYSIGLIDHSALMVEGYDYNLADQIVTVAAGTGAGTLRQAVIDVGVGESITFNIAGNDTVDIGTTEIAITQSMSINGYNNATTNDVTVQVTTPGAGGDAAHVFYINSATAVVNISNMAIQGGDVTGNGGSINVDAGELNLDNVHVSGSQASGRGGGIAITAGATLNMNNSSITGANTTGTGGNGVGGGLWSGGTTTITNSTFSNNSADGDFGGGVSNYGILTITGSTISNNTAGRGSGGVDSYGNEFAGVTTTIVSSTISGNSSTGTTADDGGGGVGNYENTTTYIINSTISDNTATLNGGGIYSTNKDASTLYILNSTIINNTDNNSAGDDIYVDTANTTAYAYFSRYDAAKTVGTINVQADAPNQTGVYNAELGALANNGGLTETMAILAGSSMINNGTFAYDTNGSGAGYYFLANDGNYHQLSNYATSTAVEPAGKITTDQRGELRQATPSIGSYEYYAPSLLQYRTVADGNWSSTAIWETSNDGGTTWIAAVDTPDATDETITIRNTVAVDADVTIDQTTVDSGATLTVATGITLGVVDGTGTDLTVTGSFTDNGTTTAASGTAVSYDGGDQTIAAIAYSELLISGAGTTKTFADGTTSISQEVVINDALTLTGSSTGNVTVQVTTPGAGGTDSRVFNVNAGAGNDVTIENITILGGDILANGDTPAGHGGAIYVTSGALTLNYVDISQGKSWDGGGVANYGADDLTITYSTIHDNFADNDGGGVFNDGNNLIILNSTIANNTSNDNGGGIMQYTSATGDLILVDSTVSGNTATNASGGINIRNGNGYILNSTIINNTSTNSTDDIYIIAGSELNTYFSRYDAAKISGTVNTQADAPNQTGVYNAELGTLTDNGGQTPTLAVLAGSSMISNGTLAYNNATDGYYFEGNTGISHQLTNYANTSITITPAEAITDDQRNEARLTDPSIGAYEYQTHIYRTVADGNWSNIAIWEISLDGGTTWIAATDTPDATDDTITVRNAVTVDTNISIDQTTIDSGAALTVATGITLGIADGDSTDLTVTGSFANNGTVTTTSGTAVSYNGASQNIVAIDYSELLISGTGTKTFADGTTSVEQEIVISDALTLTGSDAGAVTVTAATGSNARVFNLNPAAGNSVDISNITIDGDDISGNTGTAAFGGGVYISSGTLNLDSAVVTGSTAAAGGAIYNDQATVNITETTISGNSSTGDGGGVFSNNGDLNISYSTLDNNSATDQGGGVYISQGTASVMNSTIANNSALHGAGISLKGDSAHTAGTGGTLSLVNSTISSNSATGDGGGIDTNDGSTMYMLNSTVINNSAANDGDDLWISATDNISAYFSRYNGVFIEAGGSINTDIDSPNQTAVYNNELSPLANNGGITETMAVAASSDMVANGTLVYNNSTDGYYFEDNNGVSHQLSSYGTTVTVNPADEISDDQRHELRQTAPSIGAYEYQAPLQYRTIADGNWSTVAIWETSNDGGTTWIAAIDTPDVADDTITVRNTVAVDVNITIDQTTIDSGAALTVATGISLGIADGTGTDLTVTGSFTNNGTATTTAGTVVSYNGGNQTIAAIDYAELTISGAGTTKIFADGTTSVAQEITINDALSVTGSDAGNVTVQVTTPGTGGTNARVFNVAPGAGNTVDIANITVKGGDLTGNGGGVYVADGTLNLTDAVIDGSTATLGGALYNDGAIVNIATSVISNNTSTGDGGGLYNNAGTMNVTYSTVTGNTGGDDGGGIYSSGGDLYVAYSTIDNNSSGNRGGGIHVYPGNATILNSTIADNSSTRNGGGLFLRDATGQVLNTTISGNSSGNQGGGLFNNNSTTQLVNTAIINNTANSSSTNDIRVTNGSIEAYFSRYDVISGTINTQATAPNETGIYVVGELGALADNGGDTQTMAVASTSAMLATGTRIYYNPTDGYYFQDSNGDYRLTSDYSIITPASPTTDKIGDDQRGEYRLQPPTMGAYEYPTPTAYRTVSDGNWSDIATWEVNIGTVSSPEWVAAIHTPTASNADTITVSNIVTADIAVSIDQTTIDSGAALTVNSGIALAIVDGAGTDLTVTGSFTNSGTTTTVSGTEVSYNGGNQTIAAIDYSQLSISGAGTIKTFADGTTSVAQEIALTDALTLTGSASGNVTIQVTTPGTTNARVFNIDPGAGNAVDISNITVNGGDISSNGDVDAGYGGAIYLATGDLNLTGVEVAGSTAYTGGGIFGAANTAIMVVDSTISSNTAIFAGGGIGTLGTIDMLNSTVTGNSADIGAGIAHAGELNLINSTVSANTATTSGGGIYSFQTTANILNSAVINNTAPTGGDIVNDASTINAYYSRYDAAQVSGAIAVSVANQTGVYNNELGTLADNGGSTETMAATLGSPLVGNGTLAYYNATDGYYFQDVNGDYYTISNNTLVTPTDPAVDKISDDQRDVIRSEFSTIGAYETVAQYRTIVAGNWSDVAIWEVFNGLNWVAATVAPTNDNSTSIQVRDDVNVDTNVTIDQSLLDAGDTLTVPTGITLTLGNGNGTDLTIDGQLTVTGDFVVNGTATAATGSYVLYNGGDQNIAVVAYDQLGLEGVNTTKTFGDGITSVGQEVLLTDAGMTLTGNGAANVTVQVATPGTTVARLFNSNPGAGNTLTIENITMKGGDISGLVDDAANGGTIFHESGTLDISNSVIGDSIAVNGGAIYSKATLTITDSTVSNGHATNNGGGLYNAYSTMTITRTTVDSNLADRSGGGISTYQDISTTVDNSTVSNNQGRYGGILSYDSTLVLVNSTVSGNSSNSIVGGVGSFNGSISILDTTISNNTAAVTFGTVYNNRSQLYLVNSIVINNPLSSGGNDSDINTSTAGGDSYAFYSWYDGSKVSGSLITNAGAPNLISPSDGTLSALADNGGPTWTMAVQAGSNIINSGTYIYHNFIDGYYFSDQSGTTFHHLNYDVFTPFLPGGGITTDQRGLTRDPAFIPTMGAYEFNTSMVDDLPDGAEYSADEFSDLLKVHQATQDEFDKALLEFTA